VGRPLMTVHFYFVDGVCIDTALSHGKKQVIDILSDHAVHSVVLTHHHEDHSGNAAVIKQTHGATVEGHPVTVEKLNRGFKIMPYQHYSWGAAQPLDMTPLPAIVTSDNIELQPIHTPGHSRDHTVFWEKNQGWLFSGDLFIAERIKYFRADEKIKDQIASLKKTCRLDFDSLFCAHNPHFKNGKQKLRNKLQFLEDLYGRVKEFQEQGLDVNKTIKQIGLKETYFIKYFCMGNVSMKNMVRSIFDA